MTIKIMRGKPIGDLTQEEMEDIARCHAVQEWNREIIKRHQSNTSSKIIQSDQACSVTNSLTDASK